MQHQILIRLHAYDIVKLHSAFNEQHKTRVEVSVFLRKRPFENYGKFDATAGAEALGKLDCEHIFIYSQIRFTLRLYTGKDCM